MKSVLSIIVLCLAASAINSMRSDSEEDALRAAVNKYVPVIYIGNKELYFPVSVESMNINWGSEPLDLLKDTYKVSYPGDTNSDVCNYGLCLPGWISGIPYNSNAPLYVRVKKNSDGTYNIVYGVLFIFNGCGPEFELTAKISTWVGTTGIDGDKIPFCPAGVHWGDMEHVIVKLNSNFQPIKVIIAYHQWDTEYNLNEIQWEGDHPVAYMALGSHALYKSDGEQRYMKHWEESASFSSKCVKWCSKWGIPYPCGFGDCDVGVYTSGYFVDYTQSKSDSRRWLSPNPRIISSNVMELTDLSQDEINLSVFEGRLGKDIVNVPFQAFKNTVLASTLAVREVCGVCDDKINMVLSAMEGELASEAPNSFASKSWWE